MLTVVENPDSLGDVFYNKKGHMMVILEDNSVIDPGIDMSETIEDTRKSLGIPHPMARWAEQVRKPSQPQERGV